MKIRKTVGAVVTSLGLVVGMAGFAGATSGVIHNSGDDNDTTVKTINKSDVDLKNKNNLGVLNFNGQAGGSGKAKVSGNESGGSATTGNVSNSNTSATSIAVDNSGSNAAALAASGGAWADTTAEVHNSGDNNNTTVKTINKSDVDVHNTNNVGVANVNLQIAQSGKAKVSGNESNGSATTGNVSNSSNTSTSISVKN